MASFRRATQRYFDEMLEENIEEFEMEPAEALASTIDQCKAQSIDVSGFDVSGSAEGREERARARALAAELAQKSFAAFFKEAPALLSAKNPRSRHNAEALYEENGLNALFDALSAGDVPAESLGQAVDAAILVLKGAERARPGVTKLRAHCILNLARGADGGPGMDRGVVLLRTAATKCEHAKANVMQAGGGHFAVEVLEGADRAPSEVREAALLLRAICMADDLSAKISGAHERTRDLAAVGAMEALLARCADFEADAPVLSALLSALKQLCTSEEAVRQAAAGGALAVATRALGSHGGDAAMARSCLGLFRNAAADDDVKHRVCEPALLAMLLAAMDAHGADALLQEHGCGAIAAAVLRRPDLSERCVGSGAARRIVAAMRRHPGAVALQRQACLAVRNMAVRAEPATKDALLLDGVEECLRLAGRFQGAVDEAYAALRDLGLDVGIVTFNADGSVVDKDSFAFGAAKTNFNPTFDESDAVEARVQEAAHAPAADMGFCCDDGAGCGH